jgi:cytochrome c oxidase cbb3-type subunit III
MCVALAGASLFVASLASQEQKAPSDKGSPQPAAAGVAAGKQTFETRCAGCHGLDGRGGERAPDIATSARSQRHSDKDLSLIVERGLPENGMPSFSSVGRDGIANVVSYLRVLQGGTGASKLPGNADTGRALFHSKAGCAECHMVEGLGGFIAGDLSAWGGTRSAEEIRNAITKPSAPNRRGGKMVVTTHDGRHYEGMARNEDNFSIQLQTLDGEFHLFQKAELDSFVIQAEPLMPTDYDSKLTASELNDLVSFLMHSARHGKADATANEKPKGDDEEE